MPTGPNFLIALHQQHVAGSQRDIQESKAIKQSSRLGRKPTVSAADLERKIQKIQSMKSRTKFK
jgi:hypothetical protein